MPGDKKVTPQMSAAALKKLAKEMGFDITKVKPKKMMRGGMATKQKPAMMRGGGKAKKMMRGGKVKK